MDKGHPPFLNFLFSPHPGIQPVLPAPLQPERLLVGPHGIPQWLVHPPGDQRCPHRLGNHHEDRHRVQGTGTAGEPSWRFCRSWGGHWCPRVPGRGHFCVPGHENGFSWVLAARCLPPVKLSRSPISGLGDRRRFGGVHREGDLAWVGPQSPPVPFGIGRWQQRDRQGPSWLVATGISLVASLWPAQKVVRASGDGVGDLGDDVSRVPSP